MRGFVACHRSMLVFVHRADKACCVLSTMVAFLIKFICIVLFIGLCVCVWGQAGRCYVSSCITFHIISLDRVSQWAQNLLVCWIGWLASPGSSCLFLFNVALPSWFCENSGFTHFIDNHLPSPYFYFWSKISCSPEWLQTLSVVDLIWPFCLHLPSVDIPGVCQCAELSLFLRAVLGLWLR